MGELPRGAGREDKDMRRYLISRSAGEGELAQQLQRASAEATDANDFQVKVDQLKAILQNRLDQLKSSSTKEQIHSFAGSVKRIPDYVTEVIKQVGKLNIQHFAEVKEPIGADEAAELLRLKTTRGGPAQLSAFQTIVKSLLGVSIDAFSAAEESPARRGRVAEM